jgi:hypothetical protein
MDYLKINIKDFDCSKLNISKTSESKYVIKYNDKPFYIITDSKYKTYGVKKINSISKITIKVCKYMKNHEKLENLEISNPLGQKQYTLDLEIYQTKYNSTSFYEVIENDIVPLELEKINKSFDIFPIIFLHQLVISNNKLYFNYVIQQCYIKFEKLMLDKDYIFRIFNEIEKEENIYSDNEDIGFY